MHACIFQARVQFAAIFKGVTASNKVRNHNSKGMNEAHILEEIYLCCFLTAELLIRTGQQIVQEYILQEKKSQMWQFHIPKLKTDALTLTQVIRLNRWLLTILHENLVYHFLKLLSKEMSLERHRVDLVT